MAGGFYKLLLCEFVLQISEGSLDAGVVDQILVAPLVQEKSLALGPEQSIATGLLAVCWMKEGPKTRMLRAISAEAVRIENGSNHHLLKFALICSLLATGSRLRRLVSILSSGARRRRASLNRFVDLLNHLSRVFNLRDEPVVGLVLQPAHNGFVSVTVHVVEAYPRNAHTWDSPSPPHCPLDVRIRFGAYHVI